MKNWVKPFSIIFILCVGTIVYSNSFFCSFHYDDQSSIVNNPAIRNIHHLQDIWDFLPRRFILYLSIALNYHFNALNVFGYHLLNLAVHLSAAILVWWLTLLTFSTPAVKEEKMSSVVALLAGSIFVAHPIQTEAVTYIVQRDASMATLFYLASLCFYIKSRLLQDAGTSEAKQSFKTYYILSLITAVLAMFTKETAITLPLMILLYEYSFLKTKGSLNWKYLLPFLLTLFIIPLTMALTETTAARLHQLQSEPGISSIHYLLTQFRVMVTYIRLVFLPLNQNLDYDYPVFKNILEIPVLVSFLFLATILVLAKCLFSKYRLISFSIFWFFLTLLPESSILPIKDVIFEHRLYLPMVGYSIFLASSGYYLFGKKNLKTMVFVFLMIIAFYSVLTYQRNKVWRDDFTLGQDILQKSPHKARPYILLGVAYYNKGDFTQAISDFTKAIVRDPKALDAYNNRGNAYDKEGKFSQAIADYSKAIEIEPLASIYYNRGFIYYKQGNLTQAMSDFNKVSEIKPETLLLLMNVLIQKKDFINLKEYAYRIINVENDPKILTQLGVLMAQNNLPVIALDCFEKAIRVVPDYNEAYLDAGTLLANLGKYDEAIKILRIGASINPSDQRFKKNIAQVSALVKP